MPARAERLCIFSGEAGEQEKVMDFPLWWDRRGFFGKYGDRQIDTGNPFSVDYEYMLSPEEALAWDKESREKYSADPNNLKPHIVSAMQALYAALKEAQRVVVESYEWDSGLG